MQGVDDDSLHLQENRNKPAETNPPQTSSETSADQKMEAPTASEALAVTSS